MRSLLSMALVVCSAACLAQQNARPATPAAKPTLTAARIIDKSIAATGGRAAIEKLVSTWAKGSMEFTGQEAHGVMELWAKAPDKQLVVMNLESVGEIKQGFDGHTAWGQDAAGEIIELRGTPLDDTRRASVFNAPLKWRELYPKAERVGVLVIDGHKAYGVRLTTADGTSVTRYYDAATFLLVRESGRRQTAQGPMQITVDFSDYRDVDGVKAPFLIRQKLPVGEIVVHISQMKNNLEIDDARFAKPAAPAPEKP